MSNKSKLTSLHAPWATLHNAGALIDVEFSVIPDTASDLAEAVAIAAVPGNRLLWPLVPGVMKVVDAVASDALAVISDDDGNFNVMKDANDASSDTLPLDFKQFEMPLSMTPHRPNTPHGAIRGQDYTVQDNTIVFPMWTDMSADVHDVQGDDAPKRYSTVLRGLKLDGSLDLRFSGPIHTAMMLGSSFSHNKGKAGGYLSEGDESDDWRQVPGPVAMLNCLGQHKPKADKYGKYGDADPSAGGMLVTYAGSILQSALPGGGINFYQANRVAGAFAVGHLASGITLKGGTAATDMGPIIVPYEPDPNFDKHFIGKHTGEDGREYGETAGRISTNAYFFNDFEQDGPLWFNSKPRPQSVRDYAGDFFQVHCVWNRNGFHRFGNEWRGGWWEWVVSVPISPAIPPFTGQPPEDDNPPPPPPPPPPPDRPVTGGGGGGAGGGSGSPPQRGRGSGGASDYRDPNRPWDIGSAPAMIPHWLAAYGRMDVALPPEYVSYINRRIDGYNYDPQDAQYFMQGATRFVEGTNPTPVRGQRWSNADTVSMLTAATGKTHRELMDAATVSLGWLDATSGESWLLSINNGDLDLDAIDSAGALDLIPRLFNSGRRLPRVTELDADPTADADVTEGYEVWDGWHNTSSGDVFICTDNTDGAAVWEEVPGSGGGGVTSVTGTAPIASSGGATPDISLNDNGVTFAKMQDIAASRLIGRRSGSAGDPEEISLGGGLSMAAAVLSNTAPSIWTRVGATATQSEYYERRRTHGGGQVVDEFIGPVAQWHDQFNNLQTDFSTGNTSTGQNVWHPTSTGEATGTWESISKSCGWVQASVALLSEGSSWAVWNGISNIKAGDGFTVNNRIEFRVDLSDESIPVGTFWRIGMFDNPDPAAVQNSVSLIAAVGVTNFLLEIMNGGGTVTIDTGVPLDNADHLLYLYCDGITCRGNLDGNTFSNDGTTSPVPTELMGYGKCCAMGWDGNEQTAFETPAIAELGDWRIMKVMPPYLNLIGGE